VHWVYSRGAGNSDVLDNPFSLVAKGSQIRHALELFVGRRLLRCTSQLQADLVKLVAAFPNPLIG
jgi:hypothetical protein